MSSANNSHGPRQPVVITEINLGHAKGDGTSGAGTHDKGLFGTGLDGAECVTVIGTDHEGV